MLGTLNGALEARGIVLEGDALVADVEGYNEVRDRVPVLARVHLRYRIRVPPEARPTLERLLERHGEKCPTARSLEGSVVVTWEAQITDAV